MNRDLLGIFKEKLVRYSIRRIDIAATIGKSAGSVSDVLNGRINPTLSTFMTYVEAAEQLHPGFANEYWQAVAGQPVLREFIDSLDSVELGVVLTVAGQRLIDHQGQSKGSKKAKTEAIAV